MWNPLTFMLDKKQGLSVSDDIVDNNSDTTEEDLSSDDIVDGNSDATEEDPEALATNESLCDLLLQRRVLYFEAHKQDLHSWRVPFHGRYGQLCGGNVFQARALTLTTEVATVILRIR